MVHLEWQLKLWLKGDFNTLLVEGREIQHLLSRKRTKTRTRSVSMGEKTRSFAKLMMEGKVKSALRMVANDECGGVLPHTDEVLQSLKGKHPTRKQATHTALVALTSPPELVPHIILFDMQLYAELIRKVSLKTEGAACWSFRFVCNCLETPLLFISILLRSLCCISLCCQKNLYYLYRPKMSLSLYCLSVGSS